MPTDKRYFFDAALNSGLEGFQPAVVLRRTAAKHTPYRRICNSAATSISISNATTNGGLQSFQPAVFT